MVILRGEPFQGFSTKQKLISRSGGGVLKKQIICLAIHFNLRI